MDSYPYTSTGNIGALANQQTPASFQLTNVPSERVSVDRANNLVFITATNGSNNEVWSYLYNSTTGLMSGPLSNLGVPASGTPYRMPIDNVDHFALSIGSTGIESYAYNTSTGALATSPSATSTFTSANAIDADLKNHWMFTYSGTTLSDYAITPSNDTISSTATNNITINALSGATNVSDTLDKAHGILFLIIQSGGNTEIDPVPYNVTTGVFGTPATATTFSASTVNSTCDTGVDSVNDLLFLNSTTGFTIYPYNPTTALIGGAPATSVNTTPGGCARADTGNRILFFVQDSTSTAPYSVTTYSYAANGTGMMQVGSVNGTATGTLKERVAITNP
ncbi:MAG: hypothetical protein ACYDDO_07970 [Acidiferrobacterales bacterium]